jgi:uroporphyrinogen-III synthase
MPEEYVAESLLKGFGGENLEGTRILLPRAAVARDLIPVELRKRGASVDVVEAYRTVIPAGAAEHVREALNGPSHEPRRPHWITFTSSSTVTNLIAVLNHASRELLSGIKIASIGPITSATLREHGINVDVEADPHTIGGLVEAVRTFS